MLCQGKRGLERFSNAFLISCEIGFVQGKYTCVSRWSHESLENCDLANTCSRIITDDNNKCFVYNWSLTTLGKIPFTLSESLRETKTAIVYKMIGIDKFLPKFFVFLLAKWSAIGTLTIRTVDPTHKRCFHTFVRRFTLELHFFSLSQATETGHLDHRLKRVKSKLV